jgi:hypothetical protein
VYTLAVVLEQTQAIKLALMALLTMVMAVAVLWVMVLQVEVVARVLLL